MTRTSPAASPLDRGLDRGLGTLLIGAVCGASVVLGILLPGPGGGWPIARRDIALVQHPSVPASVGQMADLYAFMQDGASGETDNPLGATLSDASVATAAIDLTPGRITQCLEVAQMIDPALADGLRALRERDPALFARRLRQSTRLIALAELRERDPRLFDLKLTELRVDADVSRLARELRGAHLRGESGRISGLESQLLMFVRAQVAFSIRAREDLLCRLRMEVERMEREYDRDRANPEQLVEQRLRSLLGEHWHPGFGTAPASQ